MKPLDIWCSRNRLKAVFLEENKISPRLPVLEFLIMARAVQDEKYVFTAMEVRTLMMLNHLPCTNRTVYATLHYCLDKRFIDSFTVGRRWYEPQRWFLNAPGMAIIDRFTRFLDLEGQIITDFQRKNAEIS